LDFDGHIAVNDLFSLATFGGDQELKKILEEINLDIIRPPYPFVTPPAAFPVASSFSALWARNPVLLQSYVHTNVSSLRRERYC
jgi:hypothetical protein